MATPPRPARALLDLPGTRAPPRRLRQRAGGPPRSVPTGDGAPVLRVVGISDHRLFRSHQPLWNTAGFHVPDRPPPSSGYRGDPRLGPVALPDRRARARVLRRNAPVRTRRPPSGVPSGLAVAHLQLRACRGARVPDPPRAVLARPLSRRWAQGRRGGVHALPGV